MKIKTDLIILLTCLKHSIIMYSIVYFTIAFTTWELKHPLWFILEMSTYKNIDRFLILATIISVSVINYMSTSTAIKKKLKIDESKN